jgi:hypothetical protein
MEQPDVPAAAAASASVVSLGRALSDEARASLEAVRVAQEAARLRARRQTAHARLWFIALVGGVVLFAVAFAPRLARWRQARPKANTTAARPAPVHTAPQPVAPVVAAVATPVAAPEKPAPEPAPLAAPEAARSIAVAASVPTEGCDTGLIRKAPWRLSPEACARAFAADPNNAALALAIAHAEHAHRSPAEAAQWAKRALALDPNAAEAYVLIARAAVKSGRDEDARAAYRRYLDLAPRGWHKAEARAAVRAGARD